MITRPRVMQRAQAGKNTQLFEVTNTNDRKQMVLAIDENVARIFSENSRHILDWQTGKCTVLVDSYLERRNPGFAGAIKRAKKSGLQGVVERKGEFALIGREVFTPISGVE